MTHDPLETRLREFAEADRPPTLDTAALAQAVVVKRGRRRRTRQVSGVAAVVVLLVAVGGLAWYGAGGHDSPRQARHEVEQSLHEAAPSQPELTSEEIRAEASRIEEAIEQYERELTLAEYRRRIASLERRLNKIREDQLRDQLALYRIEASRQVQLSFSIPPSGSAVP